MKSLYLVDCESVGLESINTDKNNKVVYFTVDDNRKSLLYNHEEEVNIKRTGKNFNLIGSITSYIRQSFQNNDFDQYNIVSNVKGYDEFAWRCIRQGYDVVKCTKDNNSLTRFQFEVLLAKFCPSMLFDLDKSSMYILYTNFLNYLTNTKGKKQGSEAFHKFDGFIKDTLIRICVSEGILTNGELKLCTDKLRGIDLKPDEETHSQYFEILNVISDKENQLISKYLNWVKKDGYGIYRNLTYSLFEDIQVAEFMTKYLRVYGLTDIKY